MTSKRIIVIAGPNGAGKTTFATEFLPNEADCPRFINADLIAAGLSPFRPELAAIKAGKLMLQTMTDYLARGESFAFETTLAGTQYARRMPRWQEAGYHITLIFLSLPDPGMAIARVAERVRQGGHGVPENVVRRRFAAGRRNFKTLYRNVVDDWAEYDNSGSEPQLVDWKGRS